MDLLVLVSRAPGGSDRLSLWRMQGGKVWDAPSSEHEGRADARITHLAWSPDGLVVLCSHHPPRLSLHSVHDGSLVRTLEIPPNVDAVSGVWWLDHDGQPPTDELSDLMRRGPNTPGSAHSLLARLPLLDPYKDLAPSKPAMGMGVATAFGLPEPPKQKWYEPSPIIRSIPTLPVDLESASISASDRAPTTSRTRDAAKGKTKDEKTDPNAGTLVVVADTAGALHLYLDGSYTLGSFPVAESGGVVSLYKHASITSFAVHVTDHETSLAPTLVDVPMVIEPATRNVARASSTIRALLDYIHLGIEELALVWNGRQGKDGIKDAGNYWANLIQDKKHMPNDRVTLGPVAELTLLLLTGRATDSLQDFLGGGGKLTDRSVNHWEQMVSHALIKMRDYAGRRLAPAAERLVAVLEEIRGWAAWPDRYDLFRFPPRAIEGCLRLAHRVIAYAQWLAIEANAEHARFLEFIKFIRSEIHKASDLDANTRAPGSAQTQFDVLEAMEYIEHGFLDSPLTAWFAGPMPRTYPGESRSEQPSLSASVAEARRALESPTDSAVPPASIVSSLTILGQEQEASARSNRSLLSEHPERNLVALVGDLAQRCAELCGEAAGATTRHARVVRGDVGALGENGDAGKGTVHHEDGRLTAPRERTVTNKEGVSVYMHFIIVLIVWTIAIEASEIWSAYLSPLLCICPGSRMGTVSSDPGTTGGQPVLCVSFFFKRFPGVRGLWRVSDIGAARRAPGSVCLLRIKHRHEATEGRPGLVGAAVMECTARAREASEELLDLEILDLDFFDDDALVLVVRTKEPQGRAFIATVMYRDVEYSNVAEDDRVCRSWETLVERAVGEYESGRVSGTPVPIERSRELRGWSGGGAQLAANGRRGRRMACVLDEAGALEVLDMEGEDEAEADSGSGSERG
ncbi:hypothetical protein FRC10_007177 [Ceratobasidium sp. 414]|nr:hypothetical protein FRC10_007177 [Ceratobasidium sp. 414]